MATKLLQIARKVVDGLIWVSVGLAALGLIFEVIVIVIDVMGRAAGRPLYGSLDLITMGFVIIVFGAMSLCDRRGGHVSVDLFEPFLPPVLNRGINAFSALLGAVIFFALAWAVYDSSRISIMLNLSTNLLELPKAWFQYLLCFFAVTTGLAMLLRSVEISVMNVDVRHQGEDVDHV